MWWCLVCCCWVEATGGGPCSTTKADSQQQRLHMLLQEHQGNDPTTQLVPSGAAGSGWSKPEEPQQAPQPQPQPEVRQSALTAGSNWASVQRSGSSGWVPPAREGPFAAGSAAAVPRGSFPVERHLNPEEYPSLAATSKDKPASKRQQYEQHPHHRSQVGMVVVVACQQFFATCINLQQLSASVMMMIVCGLQLPQCSRPTLLLCGRNSPASNRPEAKPAVGFPTPEEYA